MTTPYSSVSTAEILASQDGPFAQMRTGTVVSFTTNTASVSVGGSTFPAGYLRGMTLAPGDLVQVLHQNGSWFILGAIAGVGPNLLSAANFSFEDGPEGGFPPQWFLHNVAGGSSATAETDPAAPDGSRVASVGTTSGAGATAFLYSQPIPVATGQQYTLSVFYGGSYGVGETPTADVGLLALWFANATNLYPTTSSADTVVASANDIPASPPFGTLGGTVTVPAATTFMRVALRAATLGAGRVKFDQAIVRAV